MARISDSGITGQDPPPVLAPRLRAPEGTALYVHLPYCVAKCSYCDFFSVLPERASDGPDVVETILLEAEHRAPSRPRTVFVGGGTPSLLSKQDLRRLLDGLQELTGFRQSAKEVSLECNPESLDLEKAEVLRAAGVDRLSIGFQSLEPGILSLFGRVHDSEQSFQAFRAARKAGFERLSIDLIYGVPGQELARWEADLERVIDLAPDHISAYSLAFEEGTALTQNLEAGKLQRLPEEQDLAFFIRTRELLEARGYRAYEVSNFALSNQQCQHNELYWSNGRYVGLGPGAVSYLERTRFGNPRSVGLWRKGIEASGFGATWEETLEPIQKLAETWWLGLRTEKGVIPAEARLDSGLSQEHHDPALQLAEQLGLQGLLTQRDGAWSMTPKGLPLADAISRQFLRACDPA